MRKKSRKCESEYDEHGIKAYMELSVEEKFEYLEALNRFLLRWMPVDSKRIWITLRQRGW